MTVKKPWTHADVELSDYIKGCTNIGSEQFKAELIATGIAQQLQVVRAAIKCFECGELGHIRKQCPKGKEAIKSLVNVLTAKKGFIGAINASLNMTNMANFSHSRETPRGTHWGLVPLNPTGPHSIRHQYKHKPCKGYPWGAGLDVAIRANMTLNNTSVHLLPTSVCGPLPFQTHALLLGCSSTTCTGLFILPGIINADYKGEIKNMACTPNPPCTVAQGIRLTQLIPLPAIPCSAPILQ